MKEAKVKKSALSKETLESLRELGEVLREIHIHLLSEGYTYDNGTFIKPYESKKIKQSK